MDKKTQNIIIALVGLLLVVGGGFYFVSRLRSDEDEETGDQEPTEEIASTIITDPVDISGINIDLTVCPYDSIFGGYDGLDPERIAIFANQNGTIIQIARQARSNFGSKPLMGAINFMVQVSEDCKFQVKTMFLDILLNGFQ